MPNLAPCRVEIERDDVSEIKRIKEKGDSKERE